MPDADGNATPAHSAAQIQELREHRAMLIAYLSSKVKAADWHAVADAAMDLREIEAKLSVFGVGGTP